MKNTNNKRKTKKEVHSIIVVLNLRDYFAAAALHGLCANPKCELSSMEMAEGAYRKADSMLQERQIENEIGGAA